MVDAKDNAQEPADTIAGRTMQEWAVHSRRDDCLERMVPSDLRQLVGKIKCLQSELAQTRRKALEEAASCAENTPDKAVGTMQLPPSQYDIAATIRALVEKEA